MEMTEAEAIRAQHDALPDPPGCGVCHQPITDDAEMYDCLGNYFGGTMHVDCHPGECTNSECVAAFSDPTQYADERD